MTASDVVPLAILVGLVILRATRPKRVTRDLGSPVGRPFLRRRSEGDSGDLARGMRGEQ